MSIGRRRAVVAALVAATIGWLVTGAVFAVVLVSREIRGDVLYCGDRPVGSSQYGEASWQWWYPGTRCTYEATESTPRLVREPTALSGVVAVGLLAWPAAIVVVAIMTTAPGTGRPAARLIPTSAE